MDSHRNDSSAPTRDRSSRVAATRRSNSMSSSNHRRRTRSMNSDQQLEEVAPDSEAQRWAETIRQRRISRKRKIDEEDTVLVGTRVSEGHTNWITAYNMLTGIRVATSRCNAKIDRDLTDLDFRARHKLAFDIQGNELTPSARYDFKFKDYAPWVFRDLRKIFQIDAADYLVSLTDKYILSELGSPGKSGSFFYFSRDYRFIIKTLHHAEHKFLRRILRNYHEHVKRYPNTLISQFYGLHRVKTSFGRKIHFVVMNNLFPPHMDIHSTYDVKGSTVGRVTTEESKSKNPRGTLKDLNWLQGKQTLQLQDDKKRMFLEQVQNDVALLADLEIMDYSLLLGIHSMKEANAQAPLTSTITPERPSQPLANNRTPASLTRTPSVSGQNYRLRDLRRMVTPAAGPLTLSQIAAGPNMNPTGGPSAQSTTSIDGTLNNNNISAAVPGEPQQSLGMQHNVFYQFEGGVRAYRQDGSAGDMIYFLGIIDLLTHYGTRKRLENFFKSLGKPTEYRRQISAVPPHKYAARFRDFISAMTKNSAEIEIDKINRTPSAVNLEQAMHEMERERINQSSSPVPPAVTTISAVVEDEEHMVLPAVVESPPATETENTLPKLDKVPDSRKRPGVRRPEERAPATEEVYGVSSVRRGSLASITSEPTVLEEQEPDGHDSGLATSLDCLPEETEPSRQSSYRALSKENAIPETAPPLVKESESTILATFSTNGDNTHFRASSLETQKSNISAEERASRRKGFVGVPKSPDGSNFDVKTYSRGEHEDEGYEEGPRTAIPAS